MGNDVKKETVNENDLRFRPQGLYKSETNKWDRKVLIRLILDKYLRISLILDSLEIFIYYDNCRPFCGLLGV